MILFQLAMYYGWRTSKSNLPIYIMAWAHTLLSGFRTHVGGGEQASSTWKRIKVALLFRSGHFSAQLEKPKVCLFLVTFHDKGGGGGGRSSSIFFLNFYKCIHRPFSLLPLYNNIPVNKEGNFFNSHLFWLNSHTFFARPIICRNLYYTIFFKYIIILLIFFHLDIRGGVGQTHSNLICI
jgi:hypothetical protein